jgi:hypothetical protein
MKQPVEPRARGPAVVDGARPKTGAAVVGLVLLAFVAVEALLLGLGLLVTRVLAHSSLHGEEAAFEQGSPPTGRRGGTTSRASARRSARRTR